MVHLSLGLQKEKQLEGDTSEKNEVVMTGWEGERECREGRREPTEASLHRPPLPIEVMGRGGGEHPGLLR